MKDLDNGVMAFDFENSKDREWVCDLLPWAIHSHCLNLQPTEVSLNASEIDFTKLYVWVQVHSLSLEMLNVDNAEQIAEMLGKRRYICRTGGLPECKWMC